MCFLAAAAASPPPPLLWQTQMCICVLCARLITKRLREEHNQSRMKRQRQTETGSVSKLEQIRDFIQTNFVPECDSAAADLLLSQDNDLYPAICEQTGGTEPAGRGECVNTQHRDATWHYPHKVIIVINKWGESKHNICTLSRRDKSKKYTYKLMKIH